MVPSRWRFKPPIAAWLRLVHASRVIADACVTRQLRGGAPTPEFTVIGVYSSGNAPVVEKLIHGAPHVRLWALDVVTPGLADVTVGSGPGTRMGHLNHLVAEAKSPYVVVIDDDVRLVSGTIARIVAIADRHRLDLCQPAQAPHGHWSHAITLRRPLSAVRLTNFVEVGPILIIGPRLRDEIVPFPDDSGQGWGLDAGWSKLCDTHGARLAVVDAVEQVHLRPFGLNYAQEVEQARLDAVLQDLESKAISSLVATSAVVRPWEL